jgi:hypothetical protein
MSSGNGSMVSTLRTLANQRAKLIPKVLKRIEVLTAQKETIDRELSELIEVASNAAITNFGTKREERPVAGAQFIEVQPGEMKTPALNSSWAATLAKIDIMFKGKGADFSISGRNIMTNLGMKPTVMPSTILAPLVTRGYLKKSGEGRWATYSRTNLPLPKK